MSEIRLIDMQHLGRPRVIGCWRVDDVLVDPGPGSTVETLLAALEQQSVEPRALALTHIHLDHAGASGALAERFPALEVWVHERGAPHLVDPTKLLASAERLYGDRLGPLFGETKPVPSDRIRVLEGGEQRGDFRVAYTPGHASHHVSYLHEPSGTAFSGDTTGVRIGEQGLVVPPTPPPDIDLEGWRDSLELIRAWNPSALGITHFGEHRDVADHFSQMEQSLRTVEQMAQDLDESAFAASLRALIADSTDPETAAAYEQALPPEQSFQGLLRYLRQRYPAPG